MAAFLEEAGIGFQREFPIKTDRVVAAGNGRTRLSTLFCDFYLESIKTVIEVDGKMWHDRPEVRERDAAKAKALEAGGIKLIRIPAKDVWGEGGALAHGLALLGKNHAGRLGVAWVRVEKIRHGVVTRPDHVYAKKYDICLDADEHSFCCETAFIHNSLYLIIPFRHGTPGTVGLNAMPARVYAMAQELKRSKVTGYHMERSGTGHIVPRANYKWGDRLTVAQIQAAGGSFKEQNRFAGMYKFGNARHTSYVTFRVMSQKSAGWIVPARPGIWAARTAVQVATDDGRDLLAQAFLDDLIRLGGL